MLMTLLKPQRRPFRPRSCKGSHNEARGRVLFVSQQKVSEPDEEPPAYADVVEAEPTSASSSPSQTRQT